MASEIAIFGVVAGIIAFLCLNSLRVIAWNTASIASELAQIGETLKRLAEKLPDSN